MISTAAAAPEMNENQRPEDRDCGADKDDNDIYEISSHTDEKMLRMLHPQVQVQLMQSSMRAQRNFDIVRIYRLLQDNRANIRLKDGKTYDVPTILHMLSNRSTEPKKINTAKKELHDSTTINIPCKPANLPPHMKGIPPQLLLYNVTRTKMLLRTMLLPAPLVKSIALFLPLPNLWEHQMNRFEKLGDDNEAIIYALDIMDEILESGGFLSACDEAKIPAPSPHVTWCDWKRCAKAQRAWDHDINVSPESESDVTHNHTFTEQQRAVITTKPPKPHDEDHPTMRELRRWVGYTSLLRQYQSQTNIVTVLAEKPYGMPSSIIDQLIQLADMASLCRRCCIGPHQPSCHDANFHADILFDQNALLDVLELLDRLKSWHDRKYFMK
jgi:hypothetical protein